MTSTQLPLTELYDRKPLVFAHRGTRRQAPENTIAAFKRAVDLGCDGIELDVQFSKDNHVVVFHDQQLGRTCSGSDRIADLPLSELRQVDVGSHFSPEFANERVPTLDDVFEAIGDTLVVNVEIKYFANQPTLAQAVVDIVRRHALEHRVIISSFNPFILRNVRRLAPDLPIGFLYESATPAVLRLNWISRRIIGGYQAQHPYFGLVDQAEVEWAHSHGYRVNVWTVNEPDDIQEMLSIGVDSIISDVPDIALDLRNKQPAN